MARKKYTYVTSLYNYIDKDGKEKAASMVSLCVADGEPSSIPTTGRFIKSARQTCEKRGVEYIEDSFVIINIIHLTKAEYEQLNDRTEPED